MPARPKRTDSRCWPADCQETDVDKCVQNIILQKDWTSKVYDEDAIQAWSTKSWGRDKKETKDTETLSSLAFDSNKEKKHYGILQYAVDECRWRKEEWQARAGTPAAICKNGLVLSKDNVCPTLRSSMMEDLNTLRRDQEGDMTTMALHPKYKKICQLVHPSLYAYEKGVTHVVPGIGAEVVSSNPWDRFLGSNGVANEDKALKTDSIFQWLPSEFMVPSSRGDDGKLECHINSYINNLHPVKYAGLYNKIGELFAETLLLMEEVLSEVNDNGKVRKQLPRFQSKARPQCDWRPYMGTPRPKEKKIVEPSIPSFSPPKHTAKKVEVNLHDRPLQVIVKLISMNLQPEEEVDLDSMTHEEMDVYFEKERTDCFGRGHWHVEGTQDERIVASACCYLDSENVEEEGLKFRDGSVGSGGHELGTVPTLPGRILVWPNYLHHKTGKVRLLDKKQPGHRTLCAFHLVDPTLRIRSTATVPPQQQSWLKEMVDEVALASQDDLVRARVYDSISKDGSTISYEEALERREFLSKERAGDYRVIADNFWIPCD